MEENNTLRIILNELQELQRRCFFEYQSHKFKIDIVNYDDEEIIFNVVFCHIAMSIPHYKTFDFRFREELLQKKLEDLKREINEAIESHK